MTATTVAPTLVNILLTAENMTSAQLERVLNLTPSVVGNDTNHANLLASFIAAGVNRTYPQNLALNVGATPAAATVTFSSTGPTNSETCTVLNVTLTAATSANTGANFAISATPATVAANFVACVNRNCPNVTATNALGVVTITANTPGTIGNGFELANVNLANTAFVAFASGADGDAFTINMK